MASNWQSTAGGVMLWNPIEKTSEAVRSPLRTIDGNAQRISEVQDADRSRDDGHARNFFDYSKVIKQEPQEKHFPSRSDSPDTLAAASDHGCFTPEQSIPSTPGTTTSNLFLEQLITFADLAVSEPSTTSTCSSYTAASLSKSLEYDSDRTDFLLDTPDTPCPTRMRQARTAVRSHHFAAKGRPKKHVVVKPLDLDRLYACQGSGFPGAMPRSKKPKGPKPKSSDPLRKQPNHPWTMEEKVLLLVIKRWYDIEEPRDVTAIFNKCSGLELRNNRVQAMFSQLASFGSKASREWAYVFDETLFEDPEQNIRTLRATIEDTAQALGIKLVSRDFEEDFHPGSAKKAKSPYTRKIYRARVKLLRRSSSALQTPAIQAPALQTTSLNLRLGGTTLDVPSVDEQEVIVDAQEDLRYTEHLAFRVWTDDTLFREGEDDGLVARLFANWQTSFTPPVPPHDRYSVFNVLSNDHLSKQGRGGSAFVSVMVSLIQLFTYAVKMEKSLDEDSEIAESPQIALIDLAAPSLNTRHKTHAAKDVIRNLRNINEMGWTKYRGECEYMIWANIPRDAIISIVRLSDIQKLCASNRHVAELLHLDNFTATSSTRTACERMQKANIALTVNTASAMGQLAKTLGLDGAQVRQTHVFDFVKTMFDGWCINVDASVNSFSTAVIAAAFAKALDSQRLTREESMQGFLRGVRRGAENVAKYRWKKNAVRCGKRG